MDKKPNDVELLIRKIYKKVFNDLKNVLEPNLKFSKKLNFTNRYQNYSVFNYFSKKFSSVLTKKILNKNKQQWKKYYDKLKTNKNIKLKSFIEFEKDITKEIYEQNYKFIKSIPKNILELNKLAYLKKLQIQVLKGSVGRKSLENLIKKMGSKYSKVIARTEVARLQTSVIQSRSQKLGSRAYMWLSSSDQRTRESHRKMNNVVVIWEKDLEKKPKLDKMFGNAGEFPNCRCSTEPIFDKNDLPKGNVIKYYDNDKKKIIKVSRKWIIEQIFGGEEDE